MNKKIILLISIVVVLILALFMSLKGALGVSSLHVLKEKTEQYKGKQAILEEKKDNYNNAKQKLTISMNNYETLKKEYDEASKGASGKTKFSQSESSYKLDNIWSSANKIAKKQNVKLKIDAKTSSKISDNNNYIYANLEFKASGEYKSVIDFVLKFSSDEKLNLKISKFKLSDYEKEDGENDTDVAGLVQATFTVKNVPISSESIKK